MLDELLTADGPPTASLGSLRHDGRPRNVPAGTDPRFRRRTVWPLLAAVVVDPVMSVALIVRDERSAPPATPPSAGEVPSSAAGTRSQLPLTDSTGGRARRKSGERLCYQGMLGLLQRPRHISRRPSAPTCVEPVLCRRPPAPVRRLVSQLTHPREKFHRARSLIVLRFVVSSSYDSGELQDRRAIRARLLN